jgi:hypothetical protein
MGIVLFLFVVSSRVRSALSTPLAEPVRLNLDRAVLRSTEPLDINLAKRLFSKIRQCYYGVIEILIFIEIFIFLGVVPLF